MKQKYLWLRGTEVLLWSIAIGLLSFCILKIFTISLIVAASIACMLGCLTAIIGARHIHLFSINENNLAGYLNRHYPALQESVDLLLKSDADLTSLQQIQKIRAGQRLEALDPTIKLPHHLGQAAGIFISSLIISVLLISFSTKQTEISNSANVNIIPRNVSDENLPVSIQRVSITISPPPYTRLNTKTSEDFNLKIPEASTIRWEISFKGKVSKPQIIFSGGDSILLSTHGNDFQLNRSFSASAFYQLRWQNSDSVIQYSDYYKIEVIKDQPPSIVVENINQFVALKSTDNLKIDLTARLADDYGLSSANIIATVSKGSGEAVKFREEKLAFDMPKEITGKELKATRLIDLVKLGLQPGDELYFYIEATDNKATSPNQARTETYFITLQDSAAQISAIDKSLGVDLMPEYFRSQRQIIIDSEKLLREKKHINKQAFNSRSNELGYDQKVLRLRYGEFLGEEFESSVGPQPGHGHDEEDVRKKFGHAHDDENEHNLVEDKNPEKNNSLDRAHSNTDQKEDPLKEYVHAHDNDEEATFFNQSIKAKLKAAVTIMWDAELYLRLFQPEKSLPYQYKALKLLKEISQDSRIFVHRTGFDPPPLKEEKRLTGDFSEINNSTANTKMAPGGDYPNIRNAIPVVEKLLHEDATVLSPSMKYLLTSAGQELAAIELKQPGRYLKTLSSLKRILQNEVTGEARKTALLNIRSSLWKVLPQKAISPTTHSGVSHELDLQFLKSLEAAKSNQ